MKKNTEKSETIANLRQKAEAALQNKPLESALPALQADALKLAHELQVHQIELEMQNEELILAKEKADFTAQKLSALYDFAPSGYFTLSKEGKIIELNLCGSQMLGDDRLHLAGRNFSFFLADETKNDYGLFLEKVFASSTKQCCEVATAINGNLLLRVFLTGIATENGEQCFVTMIDLTEHNKAEETRQKYEQLIQQSQKIEALGVLAGGIAHDFNNLMSGIFGYIDMAIAESTDAKVKAYLAKTMETLERARGLTGQLMTFAIGGAPIIKRDHLFPFVQKTAQFASSGANVSCEFKVPADLWACDFDRNQLGQVIDNLIINARQAMPLGGTIELTARNIILKEKEHPLMGKGLYVKISVKDFGSGMPKALISHIFDPFFSTKAQGRGLGLATCYSIMKRHGGYIEVESEPGSGSTFHVYLPASKKPVLSSAKISPVIHKGSGTFLIMDDEKVLLHMLSCMLRLSGYSVVCKEDGQDAVDFFATEIKNNRTLAGVILDLTIPGGMGGKTAIEEMRKLNKEIPVFAASGYSEDPVIKNPAEFGFTASISKPYTKDDLSTMLNTYLKPVK